MTPSDSEVRWARRCAFLFFLLSIVTVLIAPPRMAPGETIFTVPEGATIASVASALKENHAVMWASVFSVLARLEARPVLAGPYALSGNENAVTLAYRFTHGAFGVSQVKVTIPEGTSVREAALILKKNLGDFDAAAFLALAKPDEGYLFPDTYFFLPGASPESVIAQMKTTFAARTAPAAPKIIAFGKPESDVIIMASILEKEARQPETRRIVAGILWKRLKLGMPLQVDATFGYIFGTSTYSPSSADLKIDSPYNTYKYAGLPPGPIDNPGAESIEDAVTPIATPYLYYVTDKEGNIYYAATLAQHIQNIQKAAKN